jgi:hypothetical protein
MTSDSASRVTRSRRSLQRSLLLGAAVLAGVTVLRAQETPPPAPPATPPAAEPGAPPARADEAPAVPANADAPAPPAGKSDGKAGGKVGPTRDRFEPSEKVRADFDVSFPVDI